MIIAEIGDERFELKELADAEQLLRILSSATHIGEIYDKKYKRVQYKKETGFRLEISVCNQLKLMSEADAMALREKANEARKESE